MTMIMPIKKRKALLISSLCLMEDSPSRYESRVVKKSSFHRPNPAQERKRMADARLAVNPEPMVGEDCRDLRDARHRNRQR